MRRRTWLTIPLLFLMALATRGSAADLRVGAGQPYATIQAALDAAANGDVITVEPDVYPGNIDFLGKAVTLTSIDPADPAVVAATVIQGDNAGSVVTFANSEGPAAVLTGFTITGGRGTRIANDNEVLYFGAGIYVEGASPTITHNVISGNEGPCTIVSGGNEALYGGGIYCSNSDALIAHNVIQGNVGCAGGGYISFGGEPVFSHNLVYGNGAFVAGGVCVVGSGIVTHNTIYGNQASDIGGNLYVVCDPGDRDILVANNIVAGAPDGYGVYWEGEPPTAVFRANNVWNNAPANYLTVGDQTGHDGNISADPLFASAAQGDFHLETGSPSINAALALPPAWTMPLDIDGEPRVFAGWPDQGADEFYGYVPPVAHAGVDQFVPTLGVVTLDGSASYFDPAEPQQRYYWAQVAGPPVDLIEATDCQPTFTASIEAEYVFELRVGNDVYTSEADEVLVVVGNRAPVAVVGIPRLMATATPVTLCGSDSYDPDPGATLSYQWTQTDGPGVTLEDADTANPWFLGAPGDYAFELVVDDGFDTSAPATQTVRVADIYCDVQELDADFAGSAVFHYPDIAPGRAVYAVGPACDFTWDIYTKNLYTGVVESFAAGGLDTQPKIDNGIIVWFGGINWGSPWYHEPSNTGIYARRLSDGKQVTLRPWRYGESYSHPAISGNLVVWLQHHELDTYPAGEEANRWYDTPYDICGADISDLDHPVYFTIAEDVGTRDPYPCFTYTSDRDDVIDISGTLAVWEADGDIYGVDLSDLGNLRTFVICAAPGKQFDPAISGHHVVWTDARDDSGDLYAADLSDLDNIHVWPLVQEPGAQVQPALDGDLLAYVQGSGAGMLSACLLTPDGYLGSLTLPRNYLAAMPAVADGHIIFEDYNDYGEVRALLFAASWSVADGPVRIAETGACFATVTAALNAAQNGQTIICQPGVYRENIHFKNKNVTLTSIDPTDAAVVAATVLHGDGTDAVVICGGQEDDTCHLTGFTVTGGHRHEPGGGGIYANRSSIHISHCIVENNVARDNGGGIQLTFGRVEHCIVRNNRSETMAGGGMAGCHGEIINCLIVNNTTPNSGAGMNNCDGLIKNCTIANNTTVNGSGPGGLIGCDGAIINCILWGNTPAQLQQGSVPSYSCIQGWTGGGLGNFDADPLFVDAPGGDFHVRSAGWRWDAARSVWTWDDQTSPVIDAGCPGTPLGAELPAAPDDPDNLWGVNCRVNLGVYGGTAQASLAPPGTVLATDATNDGVTETADLLCLVDAWLTEAEDLPGDFNHDRFVNLDDVALLGLEWLIDTSVPAPAPLTARPGPR